MTGVPYRDPNELEQRVRTLEHAVDALEDRMSQLHPEASPDEVTRRVQYRMTALAVILLAAIIAFSIVTHAYITQKPQPHPCLSLIHI